MLDHRSGEERWTLHPLDDLVAEACRRANRDLTEEEWVHHVGGPFRRICGQP